jgi:ribosomal protein S18 acetylase RimI-like enzyme
VTVQLEFVGIEAAAVVRELMLAAFDEYRQALVVPSSALDETVEDVRAHLALGGGILARRGGRIVGSGRFEWRHDHVYIGRLSVLPEARGRGIGAAMMEGIHGLARERGVGEAHISVRVLLPKNVALYERLGYLEVSRYQHERGNELVVDMVKRL